MAKAKEYLFIRVNGEHYRTEEYPYKYCSEIIVRGPFTSYGKPSAVFKQNGQPVFKHGMETAFKVRYNLDGAEGMAIDPTKGKKNWPTDPAALADWEPFFEAWHQKKFGKVREVSQ